MNRGKKITSLFLSMIVISGIVPYTVFAKDTPKLQYEVPQEFSEDLSEVTISLDLEEMESVQINKVILPDGTEQTKELSDISFRTAENGTYEFIVYYTADNAEQEEKIPVEVTDFDQDKDIAADKAEDKEEQERESSQDTVDGTGQEESGPEHDAAAENEDDVPSEIQEGDVG